MPQIDLMERKPNILHITTWYPNTEDQQLGIFIQKHITKGFNFSENTILAIIPIQSFPKRKITINVTKEQHATVVRVLYAENKTHKYLSLKTRQKAIKLGVQEIAKFNHNWSVIQCHVAEVSLWVARTYFASKPVFLSEHWSGFMDGRFEKIPYMLRKAILKRMNQCEHIFAVSEALKTALISKGVSKEISILPNVIENKSVKVTLNESFTFGVVADLVDKVKNISGIIRAFDIVKNKNQKDSLKLVIIGDGESKSSLEYLVNSLQLSNSVSFRGRLRNEEVLSILPTFDTLVVNSYVETYSMITAEALLSGVPVIATRCGGPEQFIEPSKNGYLVEVGNELDLASKMELMINEITHFNFTEIASNMSLILSKNDPSVIFLSKIQKLI